MSLPSPDLDDRTFDQLLADAQTRIAQAGGAWRAASAGDPGVVLLDAFAYLTEQLLFRVNRIPEKAYVAFLNLIGAQLYPPTASTAVLTFSTQALVPSAVTIPRGTRVGAQRSGTPGDDSIVFVTVNDATIAAGAQHVDVRAHHALLYVDELAGTGTGAGGQTLTVAHPPILGATGDAADLLVAVEMQPSDARDRVSTRVVDGISYRVWDEGESFGASQSGTASYVVDRSSGTISFAPSIRTTSAATLPDQPATLALVPAAGARIRVSYATGGGSLGNVAAGTLTVLKDPIPGVAVTNSDAATGGRSGETLANALVRGPREFQSLQRAVTASDFELIAVTQTGAIARAKAYAKRELWTYATPGTVEVLLVPEYLPLEGRGDGAVTASGLVAQQTAETVTRIATVIDERRPLGITCSVSWVRYKTVSVSATIVVSATEDAAAVRARILSQLHLLINPLPTPTTNGWRFGRTLRVSDVVAVILAEPGVSYYDNVVLNVDDVPSANVNALVADGSQPHFWIAAGGGSAFRTINDGDGWEPIGSFAGETIVGMRFCADQPGVVALAARIDGGASTIRISSDAGDTWRDAARLENLRVSDIAWVARPHGLGLLIATDKGLYELANDPQAVPAQVNVYAGDSKFGFSNVIVARVRGVTLVAVAAEAQGGVYLSNRGGADGTFAPWGQRGSDISALDLQQFGDTAYVWAGFGASDDVPGTGCVRRELTGADAATDPSTWVPFATSWNGGSVLDLAFHDTLVYGASFDGGVLTLDSNASTPAWTTLALGCGLPEREKAGFQMVSAISVAGDGTILTGGPAGIYRSSDGAHYTNASRTAFDDRVTIPVTWLFVSGTHNLDVHNEGR
jgi:hypothetical protein